MKEVNTELLRECRIASAFLKNLAEIIQLNGMDGQAGNCIIVANNLDAAINATIAKAKN